MIDYSDITDEVLNSLKNTRNKEGFEMKDNELAKFHIEWSNVCETIRNGGKKNVKRIRLITPQRR